MSAAPVTVQTHVEYNYLGESKLLEMVCKHCDGTFIRSPTQQGTAGAHAFLAKHETCTPDSAPGARDADDE